MSIRAVNWVLAQDVRTPGAKYVLIMLALHADNVTWSCYPGQKTLARETGYSERTVREHLARLDRERWIRREPRFRRGGMRTSDRYYILPDRDVPTEEATGESRRSARKNTSRPPADSAGESSGEMSGERSGSSNNRAAHRHRPAGSSDRKAFKEKRLSPTEIVEKLLDLFSPESADRWGELMRLAVSWHRQKYSPQQHIFPVARELARTRAGELPRDLGVLRLAVQEFRQRTMACRFIDRARDNPTTSHASQHGGPSSVDGDETDRSGRGPRSFGRVIRGVSRRRSK